MAKKRKLSQLRREVMLNDIISSNLYGPRGDPTHDNLVSAANAFKLLKDDGMYVIGEKVVRKILEGENVCEKDFLNG
jgi:hypothetical protein